MLRVLWGTGTVRSSRAVPSRDQSTRSVPPGEPAGASGPVGDRDGSVVPGRPTGRNSAPWALSTASPGPCRYAGDSRGKVDFISVYGTATCGRHGGISLEGWESVVEWLAARRERYAPRERRTARGGTAGGWVCFREGAMALFSTVGLVGFVLQGGFALQGGVGFVFNGREEARGGFVLRGGASAAAKRGLAPKGRAVRPGGACPLFAPKMSGDVQMPLAREEGWEGRKSE